MKFSLKTSSICTIILTPVFFFCLSVAKDWLEDPAVDLWHGAPMAVVATLCGAVVTYFFVTAINHLVGIVNKGESSSW